MIHLRAQVEPFGTVLPEILPYLPQHWRELDFDHDAVPLAMRWEVYARAEASGELLLVTLREGRKLAAYCWLVVAPELHHGTTLSACVDIFYVLPEYRGRMGGLRLFRAVEAELRRRGVVRWQVGSSLRADSGRLFRALGFRPIEVKYAKLLSGEDR